MVTLHKTVWQFLGVSLFTLLPVNVRAADSPLAMIRTTVTRATAVLKDSAYQGAHARQERLDKVREIVLPQFDAQEIAKRTLGIYWRERTEEERQEFIQLFTALMEKSYSGTLDRYSKDVQFFFDQERIDGDFAQVDTRVYDPAQDQAFSVNYRLHRVDGKWLIYDVIIENVSMVRNYRNQFYRLLSKGPYAELVESIKRKLRESNSSSP